MYITMINPEGVRISVHKTKVEEYAKNGYQLWLLPSSDKGLVQVETTNPTIFEADLPGPDLPGGQFSPERKQQINDFIREATDAARPDGLIMPNGQEDKSDL